MATPARSSAQAAKPAFTKNIYQILNPALHSNRTASTAASSGYSEPKTVSQKLPRQWSYSPPVSNGTPDSSWQKLLQKGCNLLKVHSNPSSIGGQHLAFMWWIRNWDVSFSNFRFHFTFLHKKFLSFNLQTWKAFQSLSYSYGVLVNPRELVNLKSDTVPHFQFLKHVSETLGLFTFGITFRISELKYLILDGKIM